MKRGFYKTAFYVALVVLLALVFNNCSKIPMEPSGEKKTTCVLIKDTTDVESYGLLAIIACEPNNGPQVDNVRTYIREGDPPQDKPWPNEYYNYTQVNPNRAAPGTYMVVGKKEGYHEASTVVTVSADTVNPVIAYLVMHLEDSEPEDPISTTVPDSLIYIEGGDATSNGDTLIVQGTKIFEYYRVLVLNGSDGPIRHIDLYTGWDYKNHKQFLVIKEECTPRTKTPMDQFASMYDHPAFQRGTDPEVVTDWSYYGRFDVHVGLRGVVEVLGQNQWWDMLRMF